MTSTAAGGMHDRVFVLEVSGLTLELLRPHLNRLPTFARFFREGTWGQLTGPLQPSVAPSFSTLLTGRNPGRNGLYDFFRFPAGAYERIPYSARDLRHPTLFEILSRAGKRVGVLNVPLTYPLPHFQGGFVVSGDEDAAHDYAWPEEVKARLARDGYVVPFGASYAPGREKEFVQHTADVLAMRRRALRTLFADRQWELGMLTLYTYGELLHAFWRFYDRRHPDFRAAAEMFDGENPIVAGLRALDELLLEIVELVGPRGLVFLLGAWGHRLEHSRVHLNAVLEREGYLHFQRGARTRVKRALYRMGITAGAAERLAHRLNIYKHLHYGASRASRSAVTGATFLSYQDIDWARTRAVAIGYLGQVYLNVRGHRPLGVIPPAMYEQERERLREVLAGLRHPQTGAEMVERVFTREEMYEGPELTHAPDLVIDWKEGFVGSGGFAGGASAVTDSAGNHSSEHWRQSVILASGAGVRAQRKDARLEDVTPTILRALGVDPADELDGQVLDLWAECPQPSGRSAPP